MLRSTILLSLIAAVLAAGVAIAQSSEYKSPHYVAKFDARFKAADRNGDGALTRDEAQAAGMGRVVEQFDRIDGNHDGRVTEQEIRSFLISRVSS